MCAHRQDLLQSLDSTPASCRDEARHPYLDAVIKQHALPPNKRPRLTGPPAKPFANSHSDVRAVKPPPAAVHLPHGNEALPAVPATSYSAPPSPMMSDPADAQDMDIAAAATAPPSLPHTPAPESAVPPTERKPSHLGPGEPEEPPEASGDPPGDKIPDLGVTTRPELQSQAEPSSSSPPPPNPFSTPGAEQLVAATLAADKDQLLERQASGANASIGPSSSSARHVGARQRPQVNYSRLAGVKKSVMLGTKAAKRQPMSHPPSTSRQASAVAAVVAGGNRKTLGPPLDSTHILQIRSKRTFVAKLVVSSPQSASDKPLVPTAFCSASPG